MSESDLPMFSSRSFIEHPVRSMKEMFLKYLSLLIVFTWWWAQPAPSFICIACKKDGSATSKRFLTSGLWNKAQTSEPGVSRHLWLAPTYLSTLIFALFPHETSRIIPLPDHDLPAPHLSSTLLSTYSVLYSLLLLSGFTPTHRPDSNSVSSLRLWNSIFAFRFVAMTWLDFSICCLLLLFLFFYVFMSSLLI